VKVEVNVTGEAVVVGMVGLNADVAAAAAAVVVAAEGGAPSHS
jgi:hypothetical protein